MSALCSVNECGRVATRKKQGFCEKHFSRWRRHGDPTIVLKIEGEDLTRFWAQVEKTDGCWNWTGHLIPEGYGYISIRNRKVRAHRYSWERANGPIPDGMLIDHACWNRACVNPEHLRLATPGQNLENLSVLRSDNTTGFRGVVWDKRRNKFYGRVGKGGKNYHAGTFDTAEAAAKAAKELRLSLFTHNELDKAS